MITNIQPQVNFNAQKYNAVTLKSYSNKCSTLRQKASTDVSFKGKESEFTSEALMKALHSLYSEKESSENLFSRIISFVYKHRKTIIGNSGSNARFFNIPFVQNFGLRVKYPLEYTFERANDEGFTEVKDLFPVHNFGQAVFSNEAGITFLKKVNGTPSSINNWYYYYCNKNQITRLQAIEYLEKLAKLAELPEETFQGFAQKINIIRDKNPRLLDFASPNNFIIDFKSKEITPVDLSDTGVDDSKSLFRAMYNTLIDKDLCDFFIKKMDREESRSCIKFMDDIGEKVINAIDSIE